MTGFERRAVACLIDEAVREIHADRDWCNRCQRWLDHSEFAPKRAYCRTCESRRVCLDAARKRKAAA